VKSINIEDHCIRSWILFHEMIPILSNTIGLSMFLSWESGEVPKLGKGVGQLKED
jgi:hypothetical protein